MSASSPKGLIAAAASVKPTQHFDVAGLPPTIRRSKPLLAYLYFPLLRGPKPLKANEKSFIDPAHGLNRWAKLQ